MLGSDYHKGYAVKGIGTCGVDAELLAVFLNGKVHKRARGLAYPVFLLEADIGQIINLVKTLQKLFGVLCNAEIPYLLGFLDDIAVAYIALAALGVLV